MAMTKKEIVAHERHRLDGWQNILTGLGVDQLDKRSGITMRHNFLRQVEVEVLYHGDDIAEKAVDLLPKDMMREGFCVTADGVAGLDEAVEDWMEGLGLYDKIEQGLKWGRMYGGAGLLLGLKDNLDPSMPVNLEKIQAVEFATVLHRYEFAAPWASMIDNNVASNNYGLPEYYKLAPTVGEKGNYRSDVKIHHSRIIRFTGSPVHGKDKAFVNYWGDSILSKLWNVITNYQSSEDSAALIMQDVTKLIVKMKGLRDLILMGTEGDALVQRRLNLLSKKASVVNAVVIDEDESAETKTTSLAGIPDLLKRIESRLASALGIPHTILFGESPSGLGATGESEKSDWYETVRKAQETDVRPVAKRIVTIGLASKNGPTKGKVPEKFLISFNPLKLPSEKEQADLRKTQADTDVAYIDRGVLEAEEVANSRFGSGRYSTETQLDQKIRKLAAEANAAEADDPENPDEKKPKV